MYSSFSICILITNIEELDKMSKGDEYMELFEKEVKRLNENIWNYLKKRLKD